MMILSPQNIMNIFTSQQEGDLSTEECIWKKRDYMRQWLAGAFDKMLETSGAQGEVIIEASPYTFRYSTENLYVIGMLSIFDIRPENSNITAQDFEYLFCDCFIGYFDFPDNKTDAFVSWVARSLYRIAEEEEFLDTTSVRFLCNDLQERAARDQLFAQLGLIDQASFIPLFVSVLYVIHLRALWPHLYQRLNARGQSKLVGQFQLLELFVNRWVEEEFRFREVTREDVVEVMRQIRQDGVVCLGLSMDEDKVLYALRINSEPEKKRPVKSEGRQPSRMMKGVGWLPRQPRKRAKDIPRKMEVA